ncbi:MAG TPA: hypothetical protein VIK35_04240 [Verrucomicrobiae bacterium]
MVGQLSFSVFAADIAGTVLLPNGQPAAGAQVALAVPNYPLYLLQAKMQLGGGSKDTLVLADEGGHFSLPANESAWAIVAMNETGCTQVEKMDFENGSTITLQPWARIEGVLRVGTGVGTNQQVVLQSTGGARFSFELEAFQDWTDRDGKFVFTCVPAGNWIISHSGEIIWSGANVTVKAGETNRVTIGGTGRPVIGRLQIPATVTNSPNFASLPPSRPYVKSSDSATNRSFNYQVESTLYGTNRQINAKMNLDGTFRVEDVTPGKWWLLSDILSFPAQGESATTVATAGKEFIVPEMSGGRSDEPLDLGTVELPMIHSPQVGEAAPPLEVKTTDGKTFNLSDHRGQYVLLDFELMDLGFGKTNQSVQSAWDAFGKNGHLAMLTLQVPYLSGMTVYLIGHEPQYSWPQAKLHEVPWYESKPLRASYGLQTDRVEMDTNLPAIFLVGPDGKIVAKGLRGDAIKAAVAVALKNK